MPILTPSSRPNHSQEGEAYFTSRATAIAVGSTAVKQAVLERFPAAHAKLAPNLRCALGEDTTAAQGCKDRGTTSQGPGYRPQLLYSRPHQRFVGQFREQIGG